MRIVQINMLHNGSTGKIMLNIASCARKQGHEVWTFSPIVHQLHSHMDTPRIGGHKYFGNRHENMIHRILDRLLSINGMFSFIGTRRLLKELDRIKPDIIHLHNLHNLTMDLRSLFGYIKKHNIKTVWTLHDCWAFTGRCPHYELAKCDKWKTGCGNCPQIKEYPPAYIDLTGLMWKLKKSWFTAIDTMVITPPSQWLADQVKQSFLKDYPIQVIHNGIDLSVFKPIESDFRSQYGCENKKVILGVAFDWDERKGLDVFIELSRRLTDDYQIVLVGTDEKVDDSLPDNIISIHRTQDQHELAGLYSVADVFVNPTRADTFPTVHIEALACGTPVVTFAVGGSCEMLNDSCGVSVSCNDIASMENAIVRIAEGKCYAREACIKRAEEYDQFDKFAEYVKLYETIITE